jgi:hypothetical protein
MRWDTSMRPETTKLEVERAATLSISIESSSSSDSIFD